MKLKPNKIEERFFYDLDNATDVVSENISQNLLEKFEYEDLYLILELQFNYLDSIGIMIEESEQLPVCYYPKEIDQEEMEIYIVINAIKNDVFLSYEELEEILTAELIYYKINGALEEINMATFLN